MSELPIPYDEFTGVPDDRRPSRTRADTQRDLLDAGYSPIEAHEATTQGDVPEGARNTEPEDPLKAAMQ